VPQLIIRPAGPADLAALLALNEGAVPHVNSLARAQLTDLQRQSVYLSAALDAVGIAGFLLALDERADYASANFRYFRAHYPRFTYIDRIIVAEHRRGRGIGRELYRDLFDTLDHRAPLFACEVNLDPPNPRSLTFHEQLGFQPVGEQVTEGGAKRVCLMIRPAAAPRSLPPTG
jgi:predicted GNAT superfamily acetyltransferase